MKLKALRLSKGASGIEVRWAEMDSIKMQTAFAKLK
jgi:hypothetical protein